MKNLIRSLLIALFLTINAWLFIGHKYPVTIIGLFLSTSLLIAVRQLGTRHITKFAPEPDEVPSSLFPYVLSVPLVAGLGATVYYKVKQGDAFFFSPYLENWTLGETTLVLLLSAALVATALVIATSSVYGRLQRGELVRTSIGARVFQARRSELWRFAVYLYAILYFWLIALLAVSAANDKWAFVPLFMLCARTSLCLGIAIIGVFFWLPFSLFFIIGIGVYSWALFNSLGLIPAAVFIGAMLGGAGIFLLILGRWHAGRDPGYSVKA